MQPSGSGTSMLADEFSDLVCAVCLDHVVQEDSAIIKDCQHVYCGEGLCSHTLPGAGGEAAGIFRAAG